MKFPLFVRAKTLVATVAAYAALSLSGCGDAPPSVPDPTAETCNVYTWQPGTGDLSSFPTAEVLTPNASHPTGLQVTLSDQFDVDQFGPLGAPFRATLEDLDGVGVLGEMWLGFSGTFDPAQLQVADGEPHASDSLGILVLPENDEPYLVAVETRTGLDRARAATNILFVRPSRPLPEATRVALFATRGLEAAAGGCVAPLAPMRNLLARPDEDRREAIEGLMRLGAIGSAQDLVALHVVTTQSVTAESVAVADHIETLSPVLTDTSCTDEKTHRHCTAMLTVEDYRDDNGVLNVDVTNVVPDKTWALPVAIWLPPTGTPGPYPTIVFGHGLADDRFNASSRARRFAGMGWATVSIDALVHGDHPSTEGQSVDSLTAILRFFALDLEGPRFDALRLRDHFRQSAYDQLQLTRMLATAGDLDGDGSRDVDNSRLAFVGVSLGGVMATKLAALSDRFSAVVNVAGGGTYSRLVSDPASVFRLVLRRVLNAVTPDQFAQAMTFLQMTLDRGDGGAYGQHVLSNRFRAGSAAPDYLLGVALYDTVIPNSASYALARSLGLPLVGPALRPVIGVPVSAESLPLSGNLPGGATAGMLMFDVIDTEGTRATHDSMPSSTVAREAFEAFLASKFGDGTAVITDPYMALDIPHESTAP